MASHKNDAGQFPKTEYRLAFLDLPLEIRLEIYRQVHIDHKIHCAELDAAYPNPPWTPFITQTIQLRTNEINANFTPETDPCSLASALEFKPSSHFSFQCRSVCRIPTSFLRTNKQIYQEARDIPFLENEFVFVNWFTTGLITALAFAKGLKSWQRRLLRYIRLEISFMELQNGGTDNWKQFRRLFSTGLWSFRLRIQQGNKAQAYGASQQNHSEPVDDQEHNVETMTLDNLQLKHPPKAFAEAFKGFNALKRLEVELYGTNWCEISKWKWCKALNDHVNCTRNQAKGCIQVLCVKSVL